MEQKEIWHCPCEPDRELAKVLVNNLDPHTFAQLAKHFKKGFPRTLADKYDLVYRLIGCKKG